MNKSQYKKNIILSYKVQQVKVISDLTRHALYNVLTKRTQEEIFDKINNK